MAATRVKYLRTFSELDDIEDIWRAMESGNGGSSLFQSWEWNRTWCEHFLGDDKYGRLDTRLIESSSGQAIAILPFFKKSIAGAMIELTQFLGHRMSYHNDILLAEPKNLEFTREVANSLISTLNCRAIVHLRHLAEESPFTQELARLGLAEKQCTRLNIEADSAIHDPASRFGRSTRKRFRGQVNKLRREHGLNFQVRRADQFETALEALVDLHNRRFASKQEKTQFSGRNLQFRKDAMARFGNDVFEILELRAGESVIASTLMARDHGRYFCIQTGFDPEFAKYSPMRILLTEAIRRGFEDLDCKSFDLGPGYEKYKFDWNPSSGMNYSCCIGGAGPYAKTLAMLYRFAFRRSLPGPSKELRQPSLPEKTNASENQ
jgi:CelD/BcsL family acetyltransferase involved in cellulose biosynthesis